MRIYVPKYIKDAHFDVRLARKLGGLALRIWRFRQSASRLMIL